MKYLLCLLFCFSTSILFAQSTDTEMAFDMRNSGKIYVVVAVIAVIFVGLAMYLFSIDRRLKKLEQKD